MINNHLILFFAIILSGIFKVPAQKASENPNVLFILVDDLGWKDLGCYGSRFYDTPNLDALAEKGIRFTDAYAASPVCSPTRAAIMTGKHPVRVNITDWIPGMSYKRAEDPELLPPEDIHNMPLNEITLAEAFSQKGYKTFFAGKWHLGETPEYYPENQGFDINKGGHNKGSPPGGYYAPYNNPRLDDGPENEYLTDRLTDESIEFLKSYGDDPFLLYLAFYTVHTPIQGCDKYDAYYQEARKNLPGEGKLKIRDEHRGKTRLNQSDPEYAAMVRSMDENVGRILKYLEKTGLSKNTIIIFTSDNGGLTTTRNSGPTSVLPLRAGKGWCYEGGIRVPLIVRVPGMNEGKICSYPVTSMDYYPTLLELAGFLKTPEQHQDGKSFIEYIEDPDKKHKRTLVWHYPHYHGSTWRPGSAIRYNNWKLIEFYEEGKIELYNLEEDIGEQEDLFLKYPEKAKALKKKLHRYIDERKGKYPKQLQVNN